LHTGSYGEVVNPDARAFADILEQVQEWYPPEITYAQMNLLDSHDTARFLTIARGDKSALKLAWLAMMTYPGAPTIYYGDEIGLEGARDPDCRRAMPWDPSQWDMDLLAAAKRYIALRTKYRALRRPGLYRRLHTEGLVYAFARQLEGETVIVALNAGDKPARLDLNLRELVPDGTRLRQEWGHGEQTVSGGTLKRFQIPPRDGVVWADV
jgi:neopullulanase